METNGKEFVEFFPWAIKKGIINENTGYSIGSPAKAIMMVNEGWETMDISKEDPEVLFTRFKNIRGKEFTPSSLTVYFRRFKRALQLFLQYADNPEGFRYKGQAASAKKTKSTSKSSKTSKARDVVPMLADSSASAPIPNSVPTMDYPFPLRDGCVVRLRLPADLKSSEVDRLTSFMRTLVTES